MSANFPSFHHHHPSLLDLDHTDPVSAAHAAAVFYQSSQAFGHNHLDQTMGSAKMRATEANSAMSVTNKINSCMDSCSVVTHHHRKQEDPNHVLLADPMDSSASAGKKRKCGKYGRSSPCSNSAQSKDMRELVKKDKTAKRGRKVKEEKKLLADPTHYVHVRARRGQATDSHSLAERVRRERISERMKLLQTLVPGCEKVTGKALILDEIINYVQSLQNQVEFLSMKLASVNPMYDFGMDLQDSFFIKLQSNDHQNLISSLASPQQNSPTALNNNIYHYILENSVNSFGLEHFPNLLPSDHDHQGKRQELWEVEHEQRQNTLFSFH